MLNFAQLSPSPLIVLEILPDSSTKAHSTCDIFTQYYKKPPREASLLPIMASITKRQRDSNSPDDERPQKIAKFEARDHYLLMPNREERIAEERKKQRREQVDALKTYKAIISVREIQKHAQKLKKRDSAHFSVTQASSERPSQPCLIGSQIISYSFPRLPRLPLKGTTVMTPGDMLNDDCLLQIMKHTRLMPDLCNLLTVSHRCRGLWETCKGSIIRGIQHTQFPEYLELFGEIGRQSNEQVYNLLCAQVTEYFRTGKPRSQPERQSFMRFYEHNASLYQQQFFVFLEKLDDELNEQVKNLHEIIPFDTSSRQVTKAAVITLWRMGWKKPRRSGKWRSGPRMYPSFDLDLMNGLLEQQSEEVRERIESIVSILSHEIVDRSADLCHCAWHWILYQEKHGQPLVPYDARQWVAEALSGIIPMEIIFGGIDKAMAALRQEYTPHIAHWQTFLDQCYNKMRHDTTGIEDMSLLYLKEQLYMAGKLGVSFFWEDLVEVWNANGVCSGVT